MLNKPVSLLIRAILQASRAAVLTVCIAVAAAPPTAAGVLTPDSRVHIVPRLIAEAEPCKEMCRTKKERLKSIRLDNALSLCGKAVEGHSYRYRECRRLATTAVQMPWS